MQNIQMNVSASQAEIVLGHNGVTTINVALTPTKAPKKRTIVHCEWR